MAGKLEHVLHLSTDEQESIGKTLGKIRSVGEFLVDITKATEKLDFLKTLAESVPWWLVATAESAAAAAPPIKFLATLLGKLYEIRDPDRLAYLAFSVAYERSLEKALIFVGCPRERKPGTRTWVPKKDVDSPEEGMTFDTYSADDPLNHSFLFQANELLVSALDAAGYDAAQIRTVQTEVNMRFPSCLWGLITHPTTREKYASFADFLIHGSKEARVRAAWLDHMEYQRYLFEDQLVFGEEPFALADIYTETECGILKCSQLWEGESGSNDKMASRALQSVDSERPLDPFSEDCGGRHDLITSVMDLIGDPEFRDAIVIQGTAGSGKSTFTLRLAMELMRNGLKPIRIRFRDIPLRAMNIEDALPEAVRFWDVDQRLGDLPSAKPEELFLNMTLFDQQTKFRNATICPWVIILDGWDEVSVAAQKGFAVRVAEILSQVRDRFLNRINRPTVRVIITGRPSTAVSNSAFFTKYKKS